MFYIIENECQLEDLEKSEILDECYINIIPGNYNYHPKILSDSNNISLVYLKPLKSHKGYMICIKHSESLSIEYDKFLLFIEKIGKIYTFDKKNISSSCFSLSSIIPLIQKRQFEFVGLSPSLPLPPNIASILLPISPNMEYMCLNRLNKKNLSSPPGCLS